MPMYLSAPLPGPFRYVRRVGGRHGLAWTLFVSWWWAPTVVLVRLSVLLIVTMVRLSVMAWRGSQAAYRRWRT